MLSLDISRESFRRSKNYTGLRQQHGRVINESELNEGSDIAAEELRRAIQDVICSSGTPDDGFRVSIAAAPAVYDFDLSPGTYYIGGRRYDCYGGTFLTQPDWIQQEHDIALPALPGAARHDFVYLMGWQQEVSATEDSELFERALGGADGAGRRRRMTQVHVETDTAASCIDAMDALFPDSMIDPDTLGLVTGAALTIDFDANFVEENLCAPEVQSGYLGAENRTYRVQLTAPNRFIYGEDNASHLYRVTLASDPGDASQTIVTFQTRPRDVHCQPLALQAVEILRWTTGLPNGEHLAEPIGPLANIVTDYNPEDGTLLIDFDLATLDVDWDGAAAEDRFFFLRVWTGGSGNAQPDHTIADENPIVMEGTGLTAAFVQNGPGDFGMAGDYWVVAARPNAPDVVTPWQLMEDAADTPPPCPPHGPLRHVAPLALISWADDGTGAIVPTVHDCRERFRKLCTVPTCCEVTVGDGEHSHGDVDMIAKAIERLPLSGGKICLLRGSWTESIDLTGRSDITFSGCGSETTWAAAPGAPALTLTDCHRIAFENFAMSADDDDILRAGNRAGATPAVEVCTDLSFRDMTLLGRDFTALWLNDCNGTVISRCHVEMRELSQPRTVAMGGTDPAIFLLGDHCAVRDNWIGVTPDPLPAGESRPLAGLQLGGLSEDVVVDGNTFAGGKGNGITLGHIEWVPAGASGGAGVWTLNGGWYVNDAGCLVPWIELIPPDDADPTAVPESGGELRRIVITDNLIRDMGLNGIAVAHFFDLATQDGMIVVSDLRIERNEIRDSLTSDLEIPAPEVSYFQSYGGITLASCDLLSIRDNRIQDNGLNTSAPVCGVFVLLGQGIEIDGNQIFANGTATDALGRVGGVNVGWCLTPTNAEPDRRVRATPIRRAALSMAGNVIDSPNGQAIKAVALGPVQILGNQVAGTARPAEEVFRTLGALIALLPPFTSIATALTSLAVTDGINRSDFSGGGMLLAEALIAAMGGNAVSVFNAAWLEEFAVFLGNSELFPAVGGETMFNDNQVTLLPAPEGATNPISSVLLASMDDVSLTGNQIEADQGVGDMLSNAFTPAATVRMTSNRIQETPATCLFSGFSHSVFLNTQALNQGTHCFAATALLGTGPFTIQRRHNMSLLEGLLSPSADDGYCGLIQERLSGLFDGGGIGFPDSGGTGTTGTGTDTTGTDGDTDTTDTGDGTDTTDTGGDDKPQVPSVLCLDPDLAKAKLQDAGYEVEIQTVDVEGAKDPLVVGQVPSAGAIMDEGKTVLIVVGANDPGGLDATEEQRAFYFRCAEQKPERPRDDKNPVFGKAGPDYRLGDYPIRGGGTVAFSDRRS